MARRQVIEAPDLPHHTNPIPTAVKVGNVVFSSALMGQDPESHEVPDDPARQVELVFRSIRRVMEEAGGTVGDIGKLNVFLKDMQLRSIVNDQWLAMFPDEGDRPVRHTQQADLPGNMLIQAEFTAVLG